MASDEPLLECTGEVVFQDRKLVGSPPMTLRATLDVRRCTSAAVCRPSAASNNTSRTPRVIRLSPTGRIKFASMRIIDGPIAPAISLVFVARINLN